LFATITQLSVIRSMLFKPTETERVFAFFHQKALEIA